MSPPDSIVLGFDTSAAHCAAALVSGDRVLASRQEQMARGQAEALFPMIDLLLADTGLAWQGLAGIGVGTGPGNFTGIRIAVSAARGLAMSLGVPAVGVTGFDALAETAARPVWASLPAPRDQVYLQRLSADGDDTGPAVLTPAAEARAALAGDPTLVLGVLADPSLVAPDARAIARIAARTIAGGVPVPAPAPNYVRPPDAAPSRETGPVILS